jgi:hypothetical protein
MCPIDYSRRSRSQSVEEVHSIIVQLKKINPNAQFTVHYEGKSITIAIGVRNPWSKEMREQRTDRISKKLRLAIVN